MSHPMDSGAAVNLTNTSILQFNSPWMKIAWIYAKKNKFGIAKTNSNAICHFLIAVGWKFQIWKTLVPPCPLFNRHFPVLKRKIPKFCSNFAFRAFFISHEFSSVWNETIPLWLKENGTRVISHLLIHFIGQPQTEIDPFSEDFEPFPILFSFSNF